MTTARLPEPEFIAPLSIPDALAQLARADARPLAGGTDLLVQMRGGWKPQLLVDLKRIPELTGISLDSDWLRIGAAVSAAEIVEHAELAHAVPGLVEAAGLIGSTQIQGRASLGGNLCNASPAADTVPALIALDARCSVASPDGIREVAVEDIVVGPGETCLADDELVVEFRIPRPPARSSDAYLRLIPRTEMDIAVAGAAIALTLDGEGICRRARVVLGAVAPTAIEVPEAATALVGHALDDAVLEAVAEAARAAARPIDDLRAPASYRSRVVGVLAKRAAQLAASRAAS